MEGPLCISCYFEKIEYNLNDNVGMSYINTSLKLHRKKY